MSDSNGTTDPYRNQVTRRFDDLEDFLGHNHGALSADHAAERAKVANAEDSGDDEQWAEYQKELQTENVDDTYEQFHRYARFSGVALAYSLLESTLLEFAQYRGKTDAWNQSKWDAKRQLNGLRRFKRFWELSKLGDLPIHFAFADQVRALRNMAVHNFGFFNSGQRPSEAELVKALLEANIGVRRTPKRDLTDKAGHTRGINPNIPKAAFDNDVNLHAVNDVESIEVDFQFLLRVAQRFRELIESVFDRACQGTK